MAVSGNWTLHYSWGCSGSYAPASIVLNSNGTFGGDYTGQWRQLSGTIMLTFDGGPAKYGGTINGNVGSGVMSTFAGLDGCWYLSAQGTTGILPAEAVVEEAATQPASADGGTSLGAQREAQQSPAGTRAE